MKAQTKPPFPPENAGKVPFRLPENVANKNAAKPNRKNLPAGKARHAGEVLLYIGKTTRRAGGFQNVLFAGNPEATCGRKTAIFGLCRGYACFFFLLGSTRSAKTKKSAKSRKKPMQKIQLSVTSLIKGAAKQ